MPSKGHSRLPDGSRSASLETMNSQSPPKKLSRSRSDRYVGGVAAGIGEHLNVDPVFVRIAFVASLALGGLGLLAYVVLLAVMPVEGDPAEPLPPIEPRRRNLMIGLAIAVGIVGVAVADSGDFAGWLFGFWPGTVFGILFWVAAGAAITWLFFSGAFRHGDGSPGSPPAGTPGTGFTAPSTEPPATGSTEVVTYAESPSQLSTEVMKTRQMHSHSGATASEGSPEPSGPAPVRDDGPSTIGRIMVWFAIGTSALIVFSTLFVVSAGTTALFGGVPMAALVILLGGAMVFAGLRGRRQISLWLLTAAIAVTLPMAAVSIADLRVDGSYGDIKETPLSIVDIPDEGYKLAAGSSVIDLRSLDFESRPVSVSVETGMGLTSVIVPDQICVMGSVRGKAGVINFRGVERNGVDVDLTSQHGMKLVPGNRTPAVLLDGEFKLGAFEVVDDTEWRQFGRGGSFEHEGSATAMKAQERARLACTYSSPEKRSGPKAGKVRS